jgi:TetR/AcrR family transcriptional regulator, cholesterol catabolism regulator
MAIAAPSRRRAIEDVASTLFRERGYAATSVRDIARALDIQGPSLYAHVTAKEEVLWAIVDRAATAFEEAADGVMSGPASDPVPAASRLAALVRAHVAVIAADPELASVFVHEWRHLSGARRKAILARRDAYEGRFRQLVAGGIAAGDFAPTDPAVAATFLLTALNGIATWYRPGGRQAAGRIADEYADLAVRAVSEDHR